MTCSQLESEQTAQELGLPMAVAQPALMTYRSIGIGCFGATMRLTGMPLEKIALFINSSQVSGKGQFGQAVKLTFREGWFAPYRVVGPASMTAWFLQYSVMGVAFQFFDQSLSQMLGVKPVFYGRELMEPPQSEQHSLDYQFRSGLARCLSPLLAAVLESSVSNRAEAQRFYGPHKFVEIERALYANPIRRMAGPAFAPNAMRNLIMCQTSFLMTPITYKHYFPQEMKSKSSLFWYGLSMNIFFGNVIGITQQALWGRSLDYLEQNGKIEYRSVIQKALNKDGLSAFISVPRWFSRVLMNAPAQGTLPWFYNEILPLGEELFLKLTKAAVYTPLLKERIPFSPNVNLVRRRSNIGSLATAHPELNDPTMRSPRLYSGEQRHPLRLEERKVKVLTDHVQHTVSEDESSNKRRSLTTSSPR